MQLSFNSRVPHEVKRAADFYDEQTPGLGEDFIAAYHRALDLIEAHGDRMAIFRGNVRVMKFERFPYGIYYRVRSETARIVVVKHLHRQPDYGLDRR